MRISRITTFLVPILATICINALATELEKNPASESVDTLPKQVVINGVEFVHVPAGWFWHVVETGNRNHTPVGGSWYRNIKIWIDGFYIGKYEARARDFVRFMNSGAAMHAADYREAETIGCEVRKREGGGEYYLVTPEVDRPAGSLSWNLADEFSRWMGFRLPRETEWVKAARGTDKRTFPWGEEFPDDTFGIFYMGPGCKFQVGTRIFPNGQSPYGVFDMVSGLSEYVSDWKSDLHDANLKDGERNPPAAEQGTLAPGYSQPLKAYKGGRGISMASELHIHFREYMEPDGFAICIGARFAVDESIVREHLKNGTATVAE